MVGFRGGAALAGPPVAAWGGLVLLISCGAGAPAESSAGPEPSEANRKAAAACDGGDAAACSLLGTSLYLEARAEETSLEPALRPFLRACEAKDWHGCGMAAVVKAALKQDGRPVAARAFPLAMAACQAGNGAACIYVADWAAKAGDRTTAAAHYGSACDMNLEACGAKAMDEYACRKAAELGVRPRQPSSPVGTAGPHREARRVAGKQDIQPSMRDARGMCRYAELTPRLTVCLSAAGVPEKIVFAEFSGVAGWDRTLFETVRGWRYSPYVGHDGRAKPVCVGVTFIYRPRC